MTRGSTLVLCLTAALGACAPASTQRTAHSMRLDLREALVRAPRAAQDPQRPIPGILRSTVGFVVPMPGTEMVRMGVVQEGATLQAANRNPSLEGLGGEGLPQASSAVFIIKILPPRL